MGFFENWYTDTVDVYRVTAEKDGNVTRNTRKMVGEALPCRIHQSDISGPNFTADAARSEGSEKLACNLSADIQAGDELLITRGGLLPRGAGNEPERYFAGDVQKYYDPVGMFRTGLEHQEIGLLKQNIIGGGA